MRNVVTIVAIILLLSVTYTGMPEQADGPDAALTDAEQRIEGLRLRLNLADDQTQAVLQVLQDYCASLRAVLEEHSVTATVTDIRHQCIHGEPIYFMVDPRVFREMREELRTVRTELEERLADVLTAEQRIVLTSLRNEWMRQAASAQSP